MIGLCDRVVRCLLLFFRLNSRSVMGKKLGFAALKIVSKKSF